MIRHIIVAAAATLLAPGAHVALGAETVPETVGWTIEPGDEAAPHEVQLTISYRTRGGQSLWSNTTQLSELQGLDPAALAGDFAPVRFRLVREAGSFDCEGSAGRRRGTGECRFEPDVAFAAALDRRGIGTPTRAQQYSLALARVGVGLIDELARHDYGQPDIDDLVAAGIHGVSVEYVRAMGAAGYRVGSVDNLVSMRIHGVTEDYVAALADAGYQPDADTLVAFRIHGVSPEYIRALGTAGAGRFRPDDLVAMKIHGVDPEFVRDLASLGYRDLDAGDLTSMRIHGVTSAFVRRAVAEAPQRPSPAELVSRRIHGER
jgi:hypothetical protein